MRYGEEILRNLEEGGEICGHCEHFGADDYLQWNVCELDRRPIVFISKACSKFEPGAILRLKEMLQKDG